MTHTGIEMNNQMASNPKPARDRDYFHGCRKREDVPVILAEGLRLKHFIWNHPPADGKTQRAEPDKFVIPGELGYGVYVTENWKLANWFGQVFLRLRAQPGTRIVYLGGPADMKVIQQLKKKFGTELFRPRRSLHKVIPARKRLTRTELIELTRYHYFHEYEHRYEQKANIHFSAVRECIRMMRRYQIDAVGHPEHINGILVFHPWKFKIMEVLQSEFLYEKDEPKLKDLSACRAWARHHGDPEIRALADAYFQRRAA